MTLRMARTTKVQPLNCVAKAGIGDFGVLMVLDRVIFENFDEIECF